MLLSVLDIFVLNDEANFSWTAYQATLSRQCFSQDKLDEMILEVPFNLVFYDSVMQRSCDATTSDFMKWSFCFYSSHRRLSL